MNSNLSSPLIGQCSSVEPFTLLVCVSGANLLLWDRGVGGQYRYSIDSIQLFFVLLPRSALITLCVCVCARACVRACVRVYVCVLAMVAFVVFVEQICCCKKGMIV